MTMYCQTLILPAGDHREGGADDHQPADAGRQRGRLGNLQLRPKQRAGRENKGSHSQRFVKQRGLTRTE